MKTHQRNECVSLPALPHFIYQRNRLGLPPEEDRIKNLKSCSVQVENITEVLNRPFSPLSLSLSFSFCCNYNCSFSEGREALVQFADWLLAARRAD